MSESQDLCQSASYLPAIGDVQGGCLCCPPKLGTAPLDWAPHPGFGMLDLTCDVAPLERSEVSG